MLNRAIFLDRDGVLNAAIVRNGKPYAPTSLDELVIPKDVLPALQQMKAQGFLLIAATNQPDVVRGITTRETVEQINQTLRDKLPLDDIVVCYHDDVDRCACRKPLPGLLQQAAKDYAIDLSQSVMIGDRWKDVEAGRKAGCKTIFIDCEYRESRPINADFVTTSLTFAALWINQFAKRIDGSVNEIPI